MQHQPHPTQATALKGNAGALHGRLFFRPVARENPGVPGESPLGRKGRGETRTQAWRILWPGRLAAVVRREGDDAAAQIRPHGPKKEPIG